MQKICSGETDHFSEMVKKISKLAPPINIPWLSIQRELLPMTRDGDDKCFEQTEAGCSAADEGHISSELTTDRISPTKAADEQEHGLEKMQTQSHQKVDEIKDLVVKRQGERDELASASSEVTRTRKLTSSKHHEQYLPLQIKRVITTKKKKGK